MKVLFISRATLFSNKGGDTIQILNTAEALRHSGVEVDIELCNNKMIDYSKYNLVHFFNVIRPADILYHIDKMKIPFVLSPIYVSYEETIKQDKNLRSVALSVFNKHNQEYVKCIARNIFNNEKIISSKYLLLGHKRSIEYILQRCKHLLPNSMSEYKRLKNDFINVGEYSIIPNAIDSDIFYEKDNIQRKDKSVLCVARIEPHKNQLNIIRAIKETDYRLTIVGNVSKNHQKYFEQCKREANNNVTFINYLSQDSVADLYNQHRIHILASWFETTGLSSLEAAACGCNIVLSDKGDTKDYFSDAGYFCNPGDLNSIRNAVEASMGSAKNVAFMKKIVREYNWNITAQKTLNIYNKVLGKS